MFRKIPKIASSSKSSVGALSQASRNPNGSWQGIWNAVSCSVLLSSRELPGRKHSPWETQSTSSKWHYYPNPKRWPQDWNGACRSSMSIVTSDCIQREGTLGTRAAPSVCHCQYLSCCGLRGPNPSQSSAFSHRWPGYNDNTGMVLYSDLSKCSNTCKTNLGVGKKLHKIKQILIKKGCCPAC